jgi:hypothetical protein
MSVIIHILYFSFNISSSGRYQTRDPLNDNRVCHAQTSSAPVLLTYKISYKMKRSIFWNVIRYGLVYFC